MSSMDAYADPLADRLLSAKEDSAAEFNIRLAESSALAVRVAFSVVRNQQDAEDVAQEAFIRAYRRFDDLRERASFRAWIVRMTWRLALDWKRGAKRRTAHEDRAAALVPSVGNAETDVIATDRAARLWTAIDELPESLRLVIVLAAIEGHRVKDVADLTGLPEGTIKSRLFDARKRLQERLR
jgi:RNA polymerase sigma-70 factor (ECF subfamily)